MEARAKALLTYEQLIDLFETNGREFRESLDKSRIEFDEKLKKSNEEYEIKLKKSKDEDDEKQKKSEKFGKDIDRRIKELGIQIGGLGNKFGLYNEGTFYAFSNKNC